MAGCRRPSGANASIRDKTTGLRPWLRAFVPPGLTVSAGGAPIATVKSYAISATARAAGHWRQRSRTHVQTGCRFSRLRLNRQHSWGVLYRRDPGFRRHFRSVREVSSIKSTDPRGMGHPARIGGSARPPGRGAVRKRVLRCVEQQGREPVDPSPHRTSSPGGAKANRRRNPRFDVLTQNVTLIIINLKTM